jgi:hypothetical protein
MNSFSLGRPYTKKEKKERELLRNKKKKTDKKNVYTGSEKLYEPLFLRSWFLQHDEVVELCLSSPSISFTERYNRVEHFGEEANFFEDSFLKALGRKRATKEEVFSRYFKNQQLRWSFKKLVLQWKLKQFVMMNDTDIITFEEPKYPIIIYDFPSKKKYQLEARPFLVDCINRLLLHSDFFPEAKLPRNLITNQDLTWNQLWSVSRQFQHHGVSHWIWEGFVRTQFCFLDFFYHFEIPLKYEMVDRCFHDASQRDANWYVTELISNHTSGFVKSYLTWAVYRMPTNEHIKKWKDLCYRYWKLAVAKGEHHAEEHPVIVSGITKLLEDTKALLEIRLTYKKEHPLS